MKSTKDVFGNKVRIRACGLCFKDDSILLIKHNIDGQILWAPPGGGVEFGESIEGTIIREFKEETLLDVIPGKFLFFTEFINSPLHAIELFYEIKSYSGRLGKGNDPEQSDSEIIKDIGFFDQQKIKQIPQNLRHRILHICENPMGLLDRQGQLK